jgi:hypothetical protein
LHVDHLIGGLASRRVEGEWQEPRRNFDPRSAG